MAGDGHHGHAPVRFDPALERWSQMRENVYQHFTFTRRATRHVMLWGLVFPAAIAGVAMAYDDKFDWAGKRRGESLLAKAPAVPVVADDE
ncbi:hypothetical protein Q5752_005677 [Cryptotrichosporon argae]